MPTAAEIDGLAAETPVQNVNVVIAKPMLEKGRCILGRSNQAQVILNMQVHKSPEDFKFQVRQAQAEFSEQSCTDAVAPFYGGRSDDYFSGLSCSHVVFMHELPLQCKTCLRVQVE